MAINNAPRPRSPGARRKSDTSLATINKTDPRKLTGAQKSRVAQLIANAATRHLLDERFLKPGQRATRDLNARLNAPVVEGSTVTNREMAQQRKVAEGLRYGGQEAALNQDVATRQQMARDVGGPGGFYDQYLAELRQHQAGTQAVNAQAVGQQQALTGAVGAIQQPAPPPVVAGATQDPGVAQDAQNATALRQALSASFGAQFAQQGAARNEYANALAHVVGPTQKLGAQAQGAGNVELARKALIQEAAEKGLFGQQFETEFRNRESQNVSEAAKQKLAADIAGVKLEQSARGLDIQEQNAQTQRGNQRIAARALGVNAKAKEASSPEGKEAAKYGRSLHDWRLLGPRGRQQVKESQARRDARNYRRAHPKATKVPTAKGSGAFAGYTDAEIAKMPESRRRQLVDDYNKITHPGRGRGRGSGSGSGPDWVTSGQMGTALTQLTSLKSMAQKAKAGQPFIAGHKPQTAMDRRTAGQKILGFAPVASKLKDPILVTAALDAAYDGHLSAATVRALIAAGYKPARVAQTLGVPTARNYKPGPKPPTTSRPAASLIPGIGGA